MHITLVTSTKVESVHTYTLIVCFLLSECPSQILNGERTNLGLNASLVVEYCVCCCKDCVVKLCDQ